MKTLRFASSGPPSVLKLEEVRVPEPRPGETLVQIRADGRSPSPARRTGG